MDTQYIYIHVFVFVYIYLKYHNDIYVLVCGDYSQFFSYIQSGRKSLFFKVAAPSTGRRLDCYMDSLLVSTLLGSRHGRIFPFKANERKGG